MLLTKSDTVLEYEVGSADPNYRREETVSSGFSDITSIENIYEYGRQLCTDYMQWRRWIWDVWVENGNVASPADPWGSATDAEKQIIVDLHIYDRNLTDSQNNTNKVGYLMGKGMSQAEATGYITQRFAEHHTKDIDVSKKRAESAKIYEVVGKYLSMSDAKDFFQTIRDLFIDYKEQAIAGTNDGNVGVGLFDYIESTPGTIYESAGLASKGYTMQNGDPDEANFVAELMDVFRNGNY